MTAFAPGPDEPMLLLYDRLSPGMVFPRSTFPTGRELVERYMEISGDRNEVYVDPVVAAKAGHPGPILPVGMSGVWARQAYLHNARMPSGGVIARMAVTALAPAVVGESLLLSAEVIELDRDDPRRQVVIVARAEVDRGVERITIGRVTIDARWSPEGTAASGS